MESEVLSSQVLRALRGHRSQVQLSRRLGYRSNVAHTWETGKRFPTAAVTLAAARRVGVDVEANLRRFYKVEPAFLDTVDPTTPEGVAALLRDLRRDQPITTVAERAGRSRFQISRWLRGTAEPRLPDLFRVVEATSQRLLDFVAVLVDPSTVPGIADDWARLEAARSLFWRTPRAQLVLLGLTLHDYDRLPRHDDAWLARRLGLELYEVAGDLERLEHTGQITWDGTHWRLGEVQTVDTRRHPEAGRALKRWWAGVAADRLDHPEGSTSYNVFTVSEADFQRIVELYRSTYRQMRAIVAASDPGERLVLVQQNLLPLDRTGG